MPDLTSIYSYVCVTTRRCGCRGFSIHIQKSLGRVFAVANLPGDTFQALTPDDLNYVCKLPPPLPASTSLTSDGDNRFIRVIQLFDSLWHSVHGPGIQRVEDTDHTYVLRNTRLR